MYTTTEAVKNALGQSVVHMRLLSESVSLLAPDSKPIQSSDGKPIWVFAGDPFPDGRIEGEQLTSLSYSAGCCDGDIGIGNVSSASLSGTIHGVLNLLNMTFTAQVGVDVDGETQWMNLGKFTVTESTRTDDSTTFTAYDAAYTAFGQTYTPAVLSGSTGRAILEDISSQTGIEVEPSTLAMCTMQTDGALTGHTYREMVGYIAALCGKNAVITRDGFLRFVWFASTTQAVTADDYYSGDMSNGGKSKLHGIACTVPASDDDRETQIITVGESDKAVEIVNPYMTQSMLNSVWSQIGGYEYPVGNVGFYKGILTEPGDIISLTNLAGVTISFPVMQVSLEIDGGCRCSATSYGKSEADRGTGVKSPTIQAFNRVLDGIANGIYDGTSVTVSAIRYAIGTSGTSAPTSGWQSSVPLAEQGKWLWVKTTYSDTTEATTCSYMGTDGEDGNSVAVQSVVKVDGVTTVTLVDTAGTTSTLRIADGEDGDVGAKGANGYVHIAWANSADGTVDFSTSVSAGKSYMGAYTDNTAQDSTSPSAYSWSKIEGVGVSSVTRYYQLADTPPSAPTTRNPGSSWTTTEPTYSESNPEHLYFVDRTVYDDNTYQYSTVSLSSSYEAAKAAYQKAQDAQEAADDAQDAADDAQEAADAAMDKARDAKAAAEAAAENAASAMTSANGKNKVFHRYTAPSASEGLTAGDIWFDTANDYRINTWTGSAWSAFELGEDAIANLSITNAKIANATIQHGKIASLDMGKATVGKLLAQFIDVANLFAQDITATNKFQLNTESCVLTASTGGFTIYEDYNSSTYGSSGMVCQYGGFQLYAASANPGARADTVITGNSSGIQIYTPKVKIGTDLEVTGSISENSIPLANAYAPKSHTHNNYSNKLEVAFHSTGVNPGAAGSATASVSGSFSVAMYGYTPLCVVGWEMNSTSSSYFILSRLYLDGATCRWQVRNMSSTAVSGKTGNLTVYVLYVKN